MALNVCRLYLRRAYFFLYLYLLLKLRFFYIYLFCFLFIFIYLLFLRRILFALHCECFFVCSLVLSSFSAFVALRTTYVCKYYVLWKKRMEIYAHKFTYDEPQCEFRFFLFFFFIFLANNAFSKRRAKALCETNTIFPLCIYASSNNIHVVILYA